MLSFDISVIDIAMLIAIAVLFLLYLTGPQRDSDRQRRTQRAQIIHKVPGKTAIRTGQVDDKSSDCPHRFGYLSTRREKNVPEECVGCARLVKCLLPDE